MDRSRVEAIGPERAAAEWILRLGGSVKFQGFDWNSDYNHLPSGKLLLQSIDASGLAITSNGLEHLNGLMFLKSLSLSKCKYLSDEGMIHLQHVHRTLLCLDLSFCTALSHTGLIKHLTSLQRLEKLNITGTATTDETLPLLQKSLPYCKISSGKISS